MNLNVVLSSTKRSWILCRPNKLRIYLLSAIYVIAEINSYSFFLQFTTRDNLRGKRAIRTSFIVKSSLVYIKDIWHLVEIADSTDLC
jgi:hypothetical protein